MFGHPNRQKKEISVMWIRNEERRWFLFTNNVIVLNLIIQESNVLQTFKRVQYVSKIKLIYKNAFIYTKALEYTMEEKISILKNATKKFKYLEVNI